MLATVRISAIIDPWPLSSTLAQTTRLKEIIEGQRRTTLAIDACLAGIAGRTCILKPKWFLTSCPSGSILVNHAVPINVLKMAVLASADETDRRDAPTFAIITSIFEPFGGFQLFEAHKPSPIRRIAWRRVAHEPSWKNGRSNLGGGPARIAYAERWRPQLRIATRCKPAVAFQAQAQKPR
jgi:hypothetical protein